MRTVLVLCLILISNAASAAQVSIDCRDTPVDAVLADIARQTGERITLAAPSDAQVTARLDGVPVDDALKVVAEICGGTITKTDSGYRVYPTVSPEYALGLVREMYSRIKDIDTRSELIPTAGAKSKVVSTGHSCWKSPFFLLTELESVRDGKTSKTITVCDGKYRWSWQSESGEVTRRKVSEARPKQVRSIPVGLRGDAAETLANLQADQLPSLKFVGTEVFHGRAAYVLESVDEPEMLDYAGRPIPEKPGMGMASPAGGIQRRPVAPELEYRYTRPELNIDPPSGNQKQTLRFGVDADTGLVVYNEYVYAGYATREEASDIREAASGIVMPFHYTTVETPAGKEPRISRDVKITAARVNVGQDNKQFRFDIPPNAFICDRDLDLKACEEALKSNPDDPNLVYRHAQLLGTGYDPDTAAKSIREYERALALRPVAAGRVLDQVFQVASISRDKESITKYAVELLKERPNDRDVRFRIAYAYRNADMKKEALEEFGKLCAMYDNRGEAPLDYVASICDEMGDKARAERLYIEVLSICDEAKCPSAAQGLMQMCIAEKRPEAARQPLEAAVKRFPGAPKLRSNLGFLLSRLKEPDLAMVQFRELARISDESYLVAEAIRTLKSQRNYGSAKEIGTIFLTRSDGPKDKGSVLADMLEIYRIEDMSVSGMIAVYRKSADPGGRAALSFRTVFMETKVLPEAIERVMTALKTDPTDRVLARLLLELVDPGGSSLENATPNITAVKQLIAAFPDEAPLYGLLGEIHRAGKDYPEAAQAFRKGIELSPDQPYYYGGLASICTLAGEHEKACELGRQLVDKDSERYDFRCVLGCTLANAGKYDEAVVQLKKADELIQALPAMDRRRVSVLDALALCYEKLNDNSSIEQCLVLKADRAQVYERPSDLQSLAVFYAKQDQHDKAAAAVLKIEQESSKADRSRSDHAVQSCRWQIPQEKRQAFMTALESALKNEPELVNCRMLLAGLYIEQKMTAANALVEALAEKTWDDEPSLAALGQLIGPEPTLSSTALRVYTRLMELKPSSNYEIRLARAYQASGMRDKALALARKLVRDARNTASSESAALNSAAQIAEECAGILGDYKLLDECIDAHNAAIELFPEYKDRYQMRIAMAYESNNDHDSALATYARIVEESKSVDSRVEALTYAAGINENQKKIDQALELYKKVLQIADKDWQKENAKRHIEALTAKPPSSGNGQ